MLGTEKWGLGPTGVALKQTGPWTVGALVNHIWGFGGNDDRSNISATYLQPFVGYTTKTHTTFALITESTYDWKEKQWQVPLLLQVGQEFRIGSQMAQVTADARYWADAPQNGPEGWGFRFAFTLLFPR